MQKRKFHDVTLQYSIAGKCMSKKCAVYVGMYVEICYDITYVFVEVGLSLVEHTKDHYSL